ncbi:LamG domain-containing protein [Streptomyces sp. S.PB5]|uniref:LamG domain-containing protein n=1 Tax=Streptomyces sp. S.PB5 TaxID=3020844 RepID=UPI0025B22568|nr:LamG domain-containing protein [Streptomyces sp. S.PB5]MDN3024565.1 LamG domain-containing protein [Streptomyces sp. S.PB5]
MKQYVWRRVAPVCTAAALTVAGASGVASAAGAEAPAAPVVTSQEYPDDDNWHDGVGNYGTFVIDSASDDVVSYRYSWLGGPTSTITPDQPGGPVSVRWMPEKTGVTYLQVQAVDAVGNISARTTHDILVTTGRPAVTHWDPDQQSGADTGSGVTPGASGPSGTTVGSAAAFDGTDEAYATLDTSVDAARNFSVDAWVRPDELVGGSPVVSQEGFTLGTTTGAAGGVQWSFSLPAADGGTATISGGTPEPGEWAHLVGVYDAEKDQVRLYVDGQLTDTADNLVTAGGSGALRIGDHWQGLLTDVNVWDRVYAPGEITEAATRKAQRLGYWDLESATDGRSPAYAGGEPLTLAGDASIYAATDDCPWNPDCVPVTYPIVGNGDLLLDGDGDYATTPTALTPTDAGFSVTAQVRIDPDTATRDMTVLSQPGERTDLLTLRYLAASRTWQAVVAHEDRADAPTTTVSAPLDLDWTADDQFLAVVYDEKTDELRLYVDYDHPAATASVSGLNTWAPNGDLQVGRTLTDGTQDLAGEVDDIHTYAGVLSRTQVGMLRLGGVDIT